MHVLVVENDRDTRDLLHRALMDAGYDVSEARGLSEALRVSTYNPNIGIVLFDLTTRAHSSGMEMAGKMRQRLHHGHYILTSSDWDALGPSSLDDVTLLRKPYGKSELLCAVQGGIVQREQRYRAQALIVK